MDMGEKMNMQAHDLRLLAQWLTAADIDYLELRSPDLQIRIHHDGKSELMSESGLGQADLAGRKSDAHPVRASSVGVLLDRIPGRPEPLCVLGQAVQSGRLLALLQIGSLLLPVRAPCDGVAGPWLVSTGSVVGCGTTLLELYEEAPCKST